MRIPRFFLAAALVAGVAAPAAAQSVTLEFHDGRVNLVATDATVRAILNEWSARGGTKIINGERVPGAPISIELMDVPERQALDVVLRGVSGYMVAARDEGATGLSSFDRILIVPTSTPSGGAAATVTRPPNNRVNNGPTFFTPPAAPAFNGNNFPVIDPDDPEENPPEDIPESDDDRRPPQPQPRVRIPRDFVPPNGNGPLRAPVQPEPDDLPPNERPAVTPGNPFGVQPGSVQPGVITPVPRPQQDRDRVDPEP